MFQAIFLQDAKPLQQAKQVLPVIMLLIFSVTLVILWILQVSKSIIIFIY